MRLKGKVAIITGAGRGIGFAGAQAFARAGAQVVIAEIDEEKVAVRRDSLVCIDDRHDGEPDAVQLSNFSVVENRQTLDIEIYLTRIGEIPDHFWQGAVYQYTFTPQA